MAEYPTAEELKQIEEWDTIKDPEGMVDDMERGLEEAAASIWRAWARPEKRSKFKL